MGIFSLATMAMARSAAGWKRALIGPRALVSRRNGAETALAGRALWEIRCDNSARVFWLLASIVSTTTRDCAGRDHFQQRLFRESAEVFGVVNGIDGAAELGLTPHLIDPFDLAELFPRRGHQLLLLTLHDRGAQRGDRSVARIEIQFIQPGQEPAGGMALVSTACRAACQQP